MSVTKISPVGQVLLCRDVPFTNSYNDTILFKDGTSQIEYFNSKVKYRIDNYAIITFGEVLRIPVEQDNIAECNYLLFRNSNFNNKWYFAFITDIQYVNINMCHVTYEIDVIQTYMLDWKLGYSYIERSHTATDLLGGNLVADDINVNESINSDVIFHSYGNNKVGMYYVDESSQGGEEINNIYSGYNFVGGPMPIPINVNLKLAELNKDGYGDRVSCIFMYPSICDSGESEYVTIPVPKNINGYKPKNKKLFSYPYCYVQADDGQGSSGQFYFEYSYEANKSLQFTIIGKLATQPCVMTVVNEYNAAAIDYENAIYTANFPICSYALDGYQNYIAQNKNTISNQLGAAAFGTVASAVSILASPKSGVMGAIGVAGSLFSATSMMGKLSDKERVSNEGKGQVLADGIRMAINHCGITFYVKTIPQYLARIIDDRFSVFGYPIKSLGQIDIESRPSWNYIKTNKANITGNIGFSNLEKIKQIFDNGITFWHTTDVGNYELDNSVE